MLRRRRLRFHTSVQFMQRGKWLLFIFLFIFLGFMMIYWLEQTIQPVLRTIALTEIKRTAQQSVSFGVLEIAKQHDVKHLMKVDKDRQGRVSLIEINPGQQAQLYSKVSQTIHKKLKEMADHTIELRLGQLLQSSFFAKYGPKIPVQIWPKGASKISLQPRIESAGINTVMVALTLKIHTEVGLVVPFSEQTAPIDLEYPLGEMFMMGEVPEYYYYMEQGKTKQIPPPAQPMIPNKSQHE
ncbi:sporulation protein YunB [Seinonella peptonophila]|uniref:Sporulation protein YunB n=1 Tax=Seinonella peptonophila TaxID=112248 RepID=A0A1M4WL74_9BACL|nr:sporulation protein YunB [Seinonella peptonophila]SHE81900.1 sporulation protein YunB [Seinonella peptonophila]